MSCIFCEILEGKREGHFFYEDKDHVAFVDRYPIDLGHSLIVPRNHHERITDMQAESVGNLFSIVPKIANAVMDATGADAFSIAQNNGRAAKQIIPHVHIHLIPRYKSKGTIWTKREISADDDLAELAKKIRSFLT